MSSESILPTFGPAPPNIRRATIPRDLQPDVPDARDALRARPRSEPEPEPQQPRSEDEQGLAGRPVSVSGSAAINAQAEESAELAPPPQPAAPRPSLLEQANEEAAASEDDVNASGLTDEEEAYVRELQAIDREVRSHEAAHAATGGAYAGRPSYEYVTGPDGVRYAVSGAVQIDVAPVAGDPEATIRKLEVVRRSALAPAQPSGQDRAVAAQAEAGIREARAEQQAQRAEEAEAQLNGEEPAEDGSDDLTLNQAEDTGDDTSGFGQAPEDQSGSGESPQQAISSAAVTGLFAEAASSTAPRQPAAIDLIA